MSRSIGQQKENMALQFLKKQKLKLIRRNFNLRCGEIDLIMQDSDTIVFIEVRYRAHQHYGDALASISYHKQQRIRRTASLFLNQRAYLQQRNCRFDVIAIGQGDELQWLKNAF